MQTNQHAHTNKDINRYMHAFVRVHVARFEKPLSITTTTPTSPIIRHRAQHRFGIDSEPSFVARSCKLNNKQHRLRCRCKLGDRFLGVLSTHAPRTICHTSDTDSRAAAGGGACSRRFWRDVLHHRPALRRDEGARLR